MIDIYWAERPARTIRIDVVDDWTWEELQKVVTRGLDMARRLLSDETRPTRHIAPRVDYIYDFRHARVIARPTLNMSNLCIIARRQIPETGVIAVMTTNVLTRTMFTTCSQFCTEAKQYYYLVPDLAHAEWLITTTRVMK